jgi:ABC-type phosphate transport system auxiliary subunit
MSRITILAVLLCSSLFSQAQQIKFSNNDESTKVKKGALVEITADSAYVISGKRASIINQKIVELDSIKAIYNRMAGNHNNLLGEIGEVQTILNQVYEKMKQDSSMMTQQFEQIIGNLDQSLVNLKTNNESLQKSNQDLQDETNKLKIIVKELKKETRSIWWNGLTDKIVAFVGGIGVGMLVMALL